MSSTTATTATPSPLMQSIDTVYSLLAANEALRERYIHDAGHLKCHLNLLAKLLNLIWSDLNKINKKTAALKATQLKLRAISKKMLDMAEGSARGREPGESNNVFASALMEGQFIHQKYLRTLIRSKELRMMTRQMMLKELAEDKVDVDAEDFDFVAEAAKLWDKLADQMRKFGDDTQVHLSRLGSDLEVIQKVFGLLNVQTEERGYYPSVYPTNVTAHVDAITGNDHLDQIDHLLGDIDQAFILEPGLIAVMSRNPNLPYEMPRDD